MARSIPSSLRSLALLCGLLLGCSSGLIGEGLGPDEEPGLPDSGLRPDEDPSARPDAAPSVAETRPVLLAPAPNLGYRKVSVIDANSGEDLGTLIDYADFPELVGGSPLHAAQSPDGRIFVLDSQREIHVFSPEGVLLSSNPLADITSPEAPKSMDFYGAELWISTNKGRVLRYSETGKPLQPKLVLPEPANLEDLLVMGNGNFMVSNTSDDFVQLFDPSGQKLEDLIAIDFPQQLQQTEDGNFMVSAYSEDAVVFFDIAGNELSRLAGEGIDNPRAVAPMRNGNFAVSVYFFSLGCDQGGCLIQEMNGESQVSASMQDGPAVRRLELAYLSDETISTLAP